MCYKIFIVLLLVMPFAAMAQSPNWKLYLNKTELLSSSVDSVANVRLSKKEMGTLKFGFYHRDKSYKRSVVIMNEQRNTVLEKKMKPSCKTASFTVAELLAGTSGQPFTVYIVDIPADPAKAMLVRMAPVAICKVEWKE